MQVICSVCGKNPAVQDILFGYIPCMNCRKKQESLPKPGGQVEFAGESIKEQRKKFRDDIEQPHRKGQLNKRWLDLYGKKRAKEHGYTDKEIKRAQYVYSGDDSYYKD